MPSVVWLGTAVVALATTSAQCSDCLDFFSNYFNLFESAFVQSPADSVEETLLKRFSTL